MKGRNVILASCTNWLILAALQTVNWKMVPSAGKGKWAAASLYTGENNGLGWKLLKPPAVSQASFLALRLNVWAHNSERFHERLLHAYNNFYSILFSWEVSRAIGLKIIIVLLLLLLPLFLSKLRQSKSIKNFLCTLSVQIQFLFVLEGGFLHRCILVFPDCCKTCLSRQHSDCTKWLLFLLLLFGMFTALLQCSVQSFFL